MSIISDVKKSLKKDGFVQFSPLPCPDPHAPTREEQPQLLVYGNMSGCQQAFPSKGRG